MTGFYRLEPTTEADRPKQPFPTKLSETGLFESVASHKPHPAAIPFDVNAPQWADGATMERFVALPGLERIEQKPQLNAGGSWSLPDGSVLVQTLSLDVVEAAGKPARKRVETRLLVRQQGEWTGYSYRWNAEQTDAELVRGRGRHARCSRCPTRPSRAAVASRTGGSPPAPSAWSATRERLGFIAAFNPLQLDRDHNYGGITDNQLRTLEHIGVFEGKLPRRPADRPRLVNPYEAKAPLEARVKSYLHVNCSTCHVNEGGGNARMELGLATPVGEMKLIDEVPAPRPLRHRRPPPRRPRLARALRALPADLAARDRPDASPGLHPGRPQGRQADRRLDSWLATDNASGEPLINSSERILFGCWNAGPRNAAGSTSKYLDKAAMCSRVMFSFATEHEEPRELAQQVGPACRLQEFHAQVFESFPVLDRFDFVASCLVEAAESYLAQTDHDLLASPRVYPVSLPPRSRAGRTRTP